MEGHAPQKEGPTMKPTIRSPDLQPPHRPAPLPSKVEPKATAGQQPVPGEFEQLPDEGDEQERAAREWLRHVEAGRIGPAGNSAI